MPRNVKVAQGLEFTDRATIDGNWNTDKMCLYDDFTAVALDAERWVFAGNNGGTEAITAGANGTVTLTTGATDDDRSLLASPLIFLCANNPIIEARFKVSASTTIGINFGFNDATTEGNDALAAEMTAAALTNAKSSDCAMFVFDTDATIDHLYVGATKNDTEGTPVLAKCVAVVEKGTAYLGGTQYLNAGSNTVTTGVGTTTVWLPAGATGTATDGTGTFTGSPQALTAGVNTLTCTAAGTVTIVHGYTPGTAYHTYRVELDASGNATFYFDGKAVGRLAACITAATPLCAFLGVIARTTAARVMTVDYIKAWDG